VEPAESGAGRFRRAACAAARVSVDVRGQHLVPMSYRLTDGSRKRTRRTVVCRRVGRDYLAQSSRSAKVGSHDVTSGIELGANAIDDFPLACRRPGGCQLLRKMLQAGEVLQELLRVDSRQLADEILEVQ